MGEPEQVGGGGKRLKKWKAEKAHITQSEIDNLESVDISLFTNKAIASTAKELNISEEEIRKIIGEEEKVSKMAKRRQTIKIRLPRYEGNGPSWRKAIHEKLVKASTNIDIRKDDPIELIVTLYFDKLAVHWHDVDNRSQRHNGCPTRKTRWPQVHQTKASNHSKRQSSLQSRH